MLYFSCHICQNSILHFEFWHQNRKEVQHPVLCPHTKNVSENLNLLGLGASSNQILRYSTMGVRRGRRWLYTI